MMVLHYMPIRLLLSLIAFIALMLTGQIARAADPITLLNVSYDPTREFYEDYNPLFAKHWKEKTGQEVKLRLSNGGSGKQARAVIDGLQADVVTLALAYDIDVIAEKAKLLPADWQSKFPHNAAPSTSTIVFLVRKGNPKQIKDWEDLLRTGVQVITPNPKTSGGARWNYLAAYGYALRKHNGDEAAAEAFVKKLFANVPILDTGARASTTSFVQRQMGDVLITWENEAFLAANEFGKGQFEVVIPSLSIRAEPPVAVVEEVAKKRGTLEAATEYLNYLYSPEAQALAAKHHFRPSDEKVAAQFADSFPAVDVVDIAYFGGWKAAQQKHFDDGGMFDRISKK
jgi:sulfate/thiosulfate transport system substrate-binding protein